MYTRIIDRMLLLMAMSVLMRGSQGLALSLSGATFQGITSNRNIGKHAVVPRSATNLYSTTDDSQQELSAQERILQKTLGIEPETADQKAERLLKRQMVLDAAKNEKKKNIALAVLAFFAAILNYGYQFTHPITSLTLLTEMQNNSADLTVIGNNGKPTVVDFWAPWCENCKSAAPTLAAIEGEYGSQVNFVMVNGDLGANWPIIERFGVDGIPHLAMVGSDGVVETALIGPIPRGVLRADLDTLLENSKIGNDGDGEGNIKKTLPYTMYDAFRSRPDMRKLNY